MKPLTIEQLKALKVGDWVWIIPLQEDYAKGIRVNLITPAAYYEVRHFYREFETDRIILGTIGISDSVLDFSDYGTKWVAYKNKEQAEGKE